MPTRSALLALCSCVLLASCATAVPDLFAQAKGGSSAGNGTVATPTRPVPSQPAVSVGATRTTWPDALELRERENMDLAREERLKALFRRENQKRIEKDTQQLIELTAAYQRAVREHLGTPEANAKLLRTIEKLANGIRQRMLGLSS